MSQIEDTERLQALRELLRAASVDFRIYPHETTHHSPEEGVAGGIGTLSQMAPSFILEADGAALCAIISGATRLSYKKIKKRLGMKNVALASSQRVVEVTGSEPGTVCLFQPGMRTIVDERLAAEPIGFGGCGVPRHTLRIRIADLVRVTRAEVFDFTEPKRSR